MWARATAATPPPQTHIDIYTSALGGPCFGHSFFFTFPPWFWLPRVARHPPQGRTKNTDSAPPFFSDAEPVEKHLLLPFVS